VSPGMTSQGDPAVRLQPLHTVSGVECGPCLVDKLTRASAGLREVTYLLVSTVDKHPHDLDPHTQGPS
jgi:hypothetical protein